MSYKIEFNHSKDLEVFAWCTEQFGGPNIPPSNKCNYGRGWYHEVSVAEYYEPTPRVSGARIAEYIVFDREQDAVMFALRWVK